MFAGPGKTGLTGFDPNSWACSLLSYKPQLNKGHIGLPPPPQIEMFTFRGHRAGLGGLTQVPSQGIRHSLLMGEGQHKRPSPEQETEAIATSK